MSEFRTIHYNYFEIHELPVGEVPYSAISKALKHEKYFRKFQPTFCRNDLLQGHLAALLYWYPHYIDQLYQFASEGKDYMAYFNSLPVEIREAFDYLFPETKKRLDRVAKYHMEVSILEEFNIKRRTVSKKEIA